MARLFDDLKNEEERSKSSDQCETVAQDQKGCALLNDRLEQGRKEHIAHVEDNTETGNSNQNPDHHRSSIGLKFSPVNHDTKA